jgi:hypothetical protein
MYNKLIILLILELLGDSNNHAQVMDEDHVQVMDELSALCHPHNIKRNCHMHAGLQVAFRFLSNQKHEQICLLTLRLKLIKNQKTTATWVNILS